MHVRDTSIWITIFNIFNIFHQLEYFFQGLISNTRLWWVNLPSLKSCRKSWKTRRWFSNCKKHEINGLKRKKNCTLIYASFLTYDQMMLLIEFINRFRVMIFRLPFFHLSMSNSYRNPLCWAWYLSVKLYFTFEILNQDLQSFTKHLRQTLISMSKSEIREIFNFYFFSIFSVVSIIFLLWGENWEMDYK